jgi:hypothetical protein
MARSRPTGRRWIACRRPALLRAVFLGGAKAADMSEPDWWPRDPHGFVFLARALEKIGAARIDGWDGTETTTDYVSPLPTDRSSYWDRQRADILLSEHRPDLGRPAIVIGAGLHELTDEHWLIARELAQRLHDEGLPRLKRLQAAQDEVVKQSTTDQLILRIRLISGGPWSDFQKEWWNMHRPEERFRRCRIDPDAPFSDRLSENDHWIFATQDSLDEMLKREPIVRNQDAEPETRLMKIVTEERELLKARTPLPKRKTLKEEIQNRHDLSGADAEAVTKIVWPYDHDSKGGALPKNKRRRFSVYYFKRLSAR